MENLEFFGNFFSKFYLNHIHDGALANVVEEDRTKALVYSVVIGIFTLGIVHLICWAIEKNITPKPQSEISDRTDKVARDVIEERGGEGEGNIIQGEAVEIVEEAGDEEGDQRGELVKDENPIDKSEVLDKEVGGELKELDLITETEEKNPFKELKQDLQSTFNSPNIKEFMKKANSNWVLQQTSLYQGLSQLSILHGQFEEEAEVESKLKISENEIEEYQNLFENLRPEIEVIQSATKTGFFNIYKNYTTRHLDSDSIYE
jgi:hypothetical protein